jgi:DNA replication protein DnaD
MAIEEAVNYNARTMKYIDSILNCWLSKGIRTINGVRAYMKEWEERRKASSIKGQGKNGFCDYDQRSYDFDKLEKQLLGMEA